jgi:hypothetical protein
VIEGVAATMPPWKLRREAIPARDGFFWFEAGLPLPGDPEGDRSLKALSWTVTCALEPGDQERYPEFSAGGGVLFDGITDEDFARRSWVLHITCHVSRSDMGTRWMPASMYLWLEGDSWDETVTRVDDAMRELDPLWRGSDQRRVAKLRYLAAALAFLEQRILVAPRRPADRPARRRLERQGWMHEPLIRVVELRKKQVRPEDRGDPRSVEWSCRWVVSGHWRQQFYPSTGDHRPVWVLPYVKGPESAPLKPPRAKVFAVVR